MSTTQPYDDRELFRRIAQGDEWAFEQIFHAYNRRLLPFVSSITKSQPTAEEIVQEVFLKIWLHRDKLPEIENPGAWLRRLASNQALNHLQRLAIHDKVIARLTSRPGADSEALYSDIDVKTIQQQIHQAVQELPEKRKEIYLLSREQGLNRKEIAEMLAISENTVKNQLRAALKHIQEHIERSSGLYIPGILLLAVIYG